MGYKSHGHVFLTGFKIFRALLRFFMDFYTVALFFAFNNLFSSDAYIYSLNLVLSMNLQISKNPLCYKITYRFHAV